MCYEPRHKKKECGCIVIQPFPLYMCPSELRNIIIIKGFAVNILWIWFQWLRISSWPKRRELFRIEKRCKHNFCYYNKYTLFIISTPISNSIGWLALYHQKADQHNKIIVIVMSFFTGITVYKAMSSQIASISLWRGP